MINLFKVIMPDLTCLLAESSLTTSLPRRTNINHSIQLLISFLKRILIYYGICVISETDLIKGGIKNE